MRNDNKHVYTYEKSDSYMCVPSCINMIIQRRGYKRIDPSTIASELGLMIPEELKNKYQFAEVSGNEQDWGVHLQESPINNFLIKNNIDLNSVFVPLSVISPNSAPDFLEENISNGTDIIVGYDFLEVFGKGHHVGHASLIGHVNDREGELLLYNPELDTPATVSINKLLRGVKKKNGGFLLFGEKDKLITEYF